MPTATLLRSGACVLAGLLLSARQPGAAAQELTAARVESAIYRAVNFILSQRRPAGHWESGEDSQARYWAGDSALAILALLHAGQDPRSEEMSRSLEWLAAQELRSTYTYSLRAQALALVPGRKFRPRLEKDLEWLVEAIAPRGWDNFGLYGYVAARDEGPGGWTDHSNSQFGVLGVWMAGEAGLTHPGLENYWQMVEDRWVANQNTDGGWGYRRGENSTGSMTAAGLATLYIVLDRVHARTGHRRATRLIRSIDTALAWFGREFTTRNPHGGLQWNYYYLYGVERAGRASGRRFFRERDWFRLGAEELLRTQQPDGSWSGGTAPLHDTAFALMFLSHGRAPLLMAKLEHGADWDTYLRDLAGLTRYCERAFERLLNWQIVDLSAPVEELLEAPVLYLCGRSAWEFDEVEVFKLRQYCQRGGLLFACVPAGGQEFELSMRRLAGRLFPDLPLRPVPVNHPLFSGEVQFVIESPPVMLHVTNGLRTLMLLCPSDLAAAWNEFRVDQRARDFELGANVYLLATDKSAPASRLDTPEIPLEPVPIERTIRVARLQYDGPWDVEPYGWTRLRHYLNNVSGARLLVTSGVPLHSLDFRDFKIAYITGTKAFRLSPPEQAGLRRFLTSGGTLLADAAGGSREFLESFEQQLTGILNVEPVSVPQDSALITGEGIPGAGRIAGVHYRRAARLENPGEAPLLRAYNLGRRLAVIYCPLDLSAGLLGTPVYGVRGYAPETCLRIVRNLLLYAHLSTAEKAHLAREQ
jgi:hypothetical protein